MTSITYRITGLMFLAITFTVFLLIFLANQQMTNLFQNYLADLYEHSAGHIMGPNMMGMQGMMGLQEQEFLSSVHDSLIWVGSAIIIVGLAASYALARSITVPLRKLNAGVREIERGNLSHKVEVDSNDEVQQLAAAFNRMVAALETNNRLRKQLLADIAHELKSPLAVIQGNLEGMIDGVIDTDKEQLTSLFEESVHLNRLINDLRDLSLAEAGQLSLERAPADINQLVSHAVGMVKHLAEGKSIEVNCVLGELPPVEVDANRMRQVIFNLLTNAVRYTDTGGRVMVETAAERHEGKNWVAISVRDTGQGIAPEDLPHIFDHFYRADKSRNRKSGGTGIGLAIVKQLVETHGGKVVVASKPSEGSCFTVVLPMAA
ncbi:sensor histidine kinase [Anaeroselena agilis]|uniref:histidine kinase n=1 Tax=Anaeroselena agilis TaxID=3063788 RepID=A0ABU3NS50_9FIRM|nr:ATP-binding protein [Selenomonadales bacterium 4137-cl]